uniref:DNA-directed RNA polymerase n=1 Tax=Mandrillus leucophaeus TaxID=9568 RepID=A0A2K5ZF09_MANLE
MSVLCWGRGAAGLRRALQPCGCPGLLAKEGILGGVCGPRRSSSASPQEQDQDRRKDWGHVELLEVLQARVRQLQAESVSEVVVNRVDVARLPERGSGDGGPQPPRKVQREAKGASPVPRSGWAQRLEKDKRIRRMHMQQLEVNLQMRVQSQSKELKVRPKHLQVEPRLLSKQLAVFLAPESSWEEQLPRVLQEAPRKLSLDVGRAPPTQAQLSGQQQKLLAFFKCCLLTDHLPLAHHLLVTHHRQQQKQKWLTLDMYNTVMLGWARQGAFRELVYVLLMVKDAGLTPDLLSYAAILQCMGRRGQDAGTIERCLEQMSQEGLKLQALFTAVPLSEEEQATVLTAVHKVKPTFSLPPQPPPAVNTSMLLRDVYAKDGPVSYPKLHLPLKTLQSLFEKQLCVELASKVCVVSVEKPALPSKEVTHARKTLQTLRDHWEKALCRVLQETKNHLEGEVRKGRFSLYPFLCLLDEREVVQMLLQVLQALPAQGESFTTLARELSARTFSRHVVQRQRLSGQVQALETYYRKYLHVLASDTKVPNPCLPRQYWEALGAPEVLREQPWPLPVQMELGKQLVEMLVQATQMPSSLDNQHGSSRLVPVLYHVYSFRSVQQIGVLKPHPAYVQLLETAAEPTLTFEAVDVPMLCPPLPWTSPHTGAFLLSPTKLMRTVEGATQHQELLETCPPTALHGALDALTQLGNCAWRVNGRVLDLVLQLFQAKGCPKGRKWWMGAEEPWQTLACCMEVANAVRCSDPAAYVSHLPVHQDGSCNGLQHYAALGRDSVGAASVNLEPSDVPQDVYSGVAAQVEVFRRQDAQRGTRVAQMLEGFITRKVVKQTVMTVVYGVTRYGGRLQIEKRLRELTDFPQEFVWEASHYLVRQVFKSLQEMFSGTRAIQHWLTESARLISHMGSVVEWVTPLGIPIIQPYRLELKVKQVRGGIQTITYTHNGDISQKPNTRKQKNGFPPNFIHSLDSSHMMLTALHCYRKGLTFVSVHDCYWTHAADVAVMNQVCREQFVRLHSEPILEDLSRFLVSRFCPKPRKISQSWEARQLKETLQAVPKPGAFDLERVKHSTYFFS